MKTTITTLLTAICVSGLLLSAAAQPAGPPDNNNTAATPDQSPPPPDATNTGNGGGQDAAPPPAMDAQPAEAAPADQTGAAPAENQPVTSTVILPTGSQPALTTVASSFTPPAEPIGTNQNDLNLNFKNAPLDMVLNYMSDAAGLMIVLDTRANGTVSVIGKHVTRDEAVDLLNSELNKSGYAAIRKGRTLTIVDKNDAKTRNIPVLNGNDPKGIPDNDEIATWIIPIRFIAASQLVSDLSSFVSSQATIVANSDGNSIIITDTQSNIRHLAEIIKSVDDSAEMETDIHVFVMKYANPNDVANELSSIFPSANSGSQSPIQVGGRGGRGGRGGGNPFAALFGGGNNANTSQQRLQKAQQISAVADSRIQAVVVTAPKSLMDQITDVMAQLDVPSDRDQTVTVIPVVNGDPYQVAAVLQNTFGGSQTARGGTSSAASGALQLRLLDSATIMGNPASTATSSGIGGTGGGGGGRAF